MTRTIPGAAYFTDKRVALVGLGLSGKASLHALQEHTEAILSAWDARKAAFDGIDVSQLDAYGYDADPAQLIARTLEWQPDLVIIAPGIRQSGVEWAELTKAGVPVWSEIELAWHLRAQRSDGSYAPWLCITGTNGKTTTVTMLEKIIATAGIRCQAVGNVGAPAVSAVSDCSSQAADVFAFELSSFQLAATHSMAPHAAIVLNIADDHLEWHSTREEYARAKARIYERTTAACIFPAGDEQIQRMVDNAEVQEGARAIAITLDTPASWEIGFVEDLVVDRAFSEGAPGAADAIFEIADLAHLAPEGMPLPLHIVKDALAAAALARSVGVDAQAVRSGLRTYIPEAHRNVLVSTVNGVDYIDDSKATNAHAAQASVLAQHSGATVWIVGGQAKGARFEKLVARVADRLHTVIVLGVDQEPWQAALAQLTVPVHYIDPQVCDPMKQAVQLAAKVAEEGHTVLLAPASASLDQFTSYADRGVQFADAVHALGGE
ncbi:MAG: UDP-N-acetylmuramoyl-L-alanine--D-glutamate ligase [Arcanobacterium sp.]